MKYYPKWLDGTPFDEPCSKVVCVGRNYSAHARELGNPVPEQPLLFMKPSTALVDLDQAVWLQQRDIHYECEIAILMGLPKDAPKGNIKARSSEPVGVSLALDLTLRTLQKELKDKGHPWERAKSFDGSCPMGRFRPYTLGEALHFRFTIDQQVIQKGHTDHMLFNIERLIDEIDSQFTLLPGDIVLTGTPEGVGALVSGSTLTFELNGQTLVTSSVVD